MWGLPKPIFKPHEYWLSKTRCCNSAYRLRYWNPRSNVAPPRIRSLQQCLPFTVLKLNGFLLNLLLSFSCNSAYRLRCWNVFCCFLSSTFSCKLQQCLPFTVLKPEILYRLHSVLMSCNSAYRLRYWNVITIKMRFNFWSSCNSAYRLRYWNNRVLR